MASRSHTIPVRTSGTVAARVVIALMPIAWATAAHAITPIQPERFNDLHTLIKPAAAEEKWAEIPWLAGLWDARTKAAAEGKPILLWEMDGHPLGCV